MQKIEVKMVGVPNKEIKKGYKLRKKFCKAFNKLLKYREQEI